MSEQYFTVNIRAYLDKDKPTYIGEDSLYELLSDFSCPDNPDVEYFLLHNAIEFTKKDQSVTYLVFNAEDASIVGYFALAVKPISVNVANISKTMAKKLARVSILDESTSSYTTAAYLIAQFLMDFYTRNKFKMFDVRTTIPSHGEDPHQLNQLLKFI